MQYKIKTVHSFCKDGVTMPFYFFVFNIHVGTLGPGLGNKKDENEKLKTELNPQIYSMIIQQWRNSKEA